MSNFLAKDSSFDEEDTFFRGWETPEIFSFNICIPILILRILILLDVPILQLSAFIFRRLCRLLKALTFLDLPRTSNCEKRSGIESNLF